MRDGLFVFLFVFFGRSSRHRFGSRVRREESALQCRRCLSQRNRNFLLFSSLVLFELVSFFPGSSFANAARNRSCSRKSHQVFCLFFSVLSSLFLFSFLHRTLRFSTGCSTCASEIAFAVTTLVRVMNELKAVKPVN